MESAVNTVTNNVLSAKKIRSRYRKCLNEIANSFSEPDNTNEEYVHDLRVNLKRVDALIDLLKNTGHKLSAGKLKSFKTLFRIAGKLRAIQVEFNVINSHFTDDSFNTNYLHQLHEVKTKRLREYTKCLGSGIPRSLKEDTKLLKKRMEQLTRKNILRYLKAERKKLGKRLRRSIYREQDLHFIRKGLKRYYLNSKTAEYNNERIERMLDLLGAWHDHQIAFDHIVKTIYTGQLTEPESEPIKQIKYDLINDKERLYEKIVAYYAEALQDINAGLTFAGKELERQT
jgi:CHAD domain-containing protein